MMKVLLFALAIIASGRAKQGFGPGGQDWGFSTVREGTHIFWWLYETQADVSDISQRPLIIWLQGGPGISASGYGNFEIIGPLDSELNPRDSSWVKDFNVLFVDNPVGAGFSYLNATTSQGYAKSNAEVANDFVVFLSDFYDVHPEFSRTPLYIVGQGYGGKFAVDITLKIWDEQQAGNLKSNISGVALGNSFVDPLTIAQYQAQYLYQVGLIDDAVNDQVFNYGIFIKNQYDSGEYHTATYEFSRMRNIISRQTDGVDFDNMLTKNVRPSSKSNAYNGMMVDNARDSVYINTLMNGPVREALSIPEESVFGANTGSVFNYLWDDVMTPVTNGVEEILNRTTLVVEVYSGNLDVTSNTAGQLAWTNNLRWNRESEFRNTLRESIWENDVLEGYRRYGGNFAFYWVNAAGHDVPAENPGAMRAILRHLTHV